MGIRALSLRLKPGSGARRALSRGPWITTALGFLIAGFAVACGGSSSPSGSSSPAATSAAPSASQDAGGAGVTATETEFKITLSRTSLSAGTVTFAVKNSGTVPHALAVRGEGVNAKTAILQPGQSANLTVTLRAGSYDVYCPVDGHKGLGMNLEIHVT